METTRKSSFIKQLTAIKNGLEKSEALILTGLLITIILLASYQIALRWFTSGGLPWIDPLLRYLVLWGGLFGAVLATSRNNHIGLDVISYMIPPAIKKWTALATLCFSLIISLLLMRASLLFIHSERLFGGSGLFGLPSWCWNLVFPAAIGLICIHFFISTLLALSNITSPVSPNETEGMK